MKPNRPNRIVYPVNSTQWNERLPCPMFYMAMAKMPRVSYIVIVVMYV